MAVHSEKGSVLRRAECPLRRHRRPADYLVRGSLALYVIAALAALGIAAHLGLWWAWFLIRTLEAPFAVFSVMVVLRARR